jgi:ubiquinone/menaquinone biosynthesis C-methylase UbiE
MSAIPVNKNEQQAEKAFSTQSVIFDKIYAENTIVSYKRDRVRQHVLKNIPQGASILELNSGTGEDALYFAQNGFKVHATDISTGMQQQLVQKMKANGVAASVTNELCSYTALARLKNKGPYDLIFSNFAGLNCTNELDKVLASFDGLLKPGGVATLVVLPKFCLWETMLLFKGMFKTAFRRFAGDKGTTAHVEGTYFKCWYYNPSYIIKNLGSNFELIGLEGLCTIVPPSYIEGFAEKHPKTYRFLKSKEDKLKSTWPWKCVGDYYIISVRKRF